MLHLVMCTGISHGSETFVSGSGICFETGNYNLHVSLLVFPAVMLANMGKIDLCQHVGVGKVLD